MIASAHDQVVLSLVTWNEIYPIWSQEDSAKSIYLLLDEAELLASHEGPNLAGAAISRPEATFPWLHCGRVPRSLAKPSSYHGTRASWGNKLWGLL